MTGMRRRVRIQKVSSVPSYFADFSSRLSLRRVATTCGVFGAAFATYAYGQEQSVTLLDLAGEGDQNKTTSLVDRAMAWITNAQQTGSGSGIGRVDVTLEQPARAVGLALGETALDVDLADDGSARHATLDFARSDLTVSAAGLHAEASRHLPKRLVFWAVDTVRAVPWIGPAPI